MEGSVEEVSQLNNCYSMEGVVEFVDESRDREGRNVGKVRVAMQNDRVTHSHEGIHRPMRQRGTQRVWCFFRSDARIVSDGHGRDNDSKISRQGRSVLVWEGTFS